jgi:hypothetical protein
MATVLKNTRRFMPSSLPQGCDRPEARLPATAVIQHGDVRRCPPECVWSRCLPSWDGARGRRSSPAPAPWRPPASSGQRKGDLAGAHGTVGERCCRSGPASGKAITEAQSSRLHGAAAPREPAAVRRPGSAREGAPSLPGAPLWQVPPDALRRLYHRRGAGRWLRSFNHLRRVSQEYHLPHVINLCDLVSFANRLLTISHAG